MSTVSPELATLDPGIYPDMTMAEYQALPYVSASRLEKLVRSPKQFKHALSEAPKETPALEKGTALHMAVLEPKLFEGYYIVLGQCDGVKKDKDRCSYQGSFYRDGQSFCKTHDPLRGRPMEDVEVLERPVFDAVTGMRDSINGHPRARSLFEGRGEFEVSIVFDDPETGVRVRMRPDRLVERAGMLVDIKTCFDAREWAFGRQAERLGYWRKLALYRRGLRAVSWPYKYTSVLAIESLAPFDLFPYLIEENDLDDADAEVTRLLNLYKQCVQEDSWPGYSKGFAVLARPSYARDRND